MELKHQIWQSWADFLRKWGIEEVVACLLEDGGPFNILAAQAIYFSQPFLGMVIAPDHLEKLADMLEDKSETHLFINFLRGGV